MNVQELRNNGFKVRCIHKRLYRNMLDSGLKSNELLDLAMTRREFEAEESQFDVDQRFSYSEEVCPFGGITRVEITTPDGDDLIGIAKCSPNDNYNKRKGVFISIGRAMNNKGKESVDIQ